MASISDLPIEVLLKIFKFYMETETQKRFLDVICNVCFYWKNICLDSSLWTKYDGTPTFKNMLFLSKKGALKNTKELTLSSTDSLKSSAKESKNKSVGNIKRLKLSSSDSLKSTTDETILFQNVQNVEVISFARVKQISNETLSIVAQNCTKLREIKIGRMGEMLITLSHKMLEDCLSLRGYGIKKIDFSFCKISNFQASIRCISDCCPNLEYLHLMNIVCSQTGFPTSYIQEHCSKLKSLNLDDNVRIENTRYTSGFPDLEEFVYSDQKGFYINNKQFECILFNSPKLKFLSLTNCEISASAMLSLPAVSVEYLYLIRSKACRDESLGHLLKKWSHSLKEIDLSYGNSCVQHAVLLLIKTPAKSVLEFLNLNYTPVKIDLVENILKDCPHLETLNLEGCKNLLRGMKRTYSSKLEFQELSEKISSYKSTHPIEILTIKET